MAFLEYSFVPKKSGTLADASTERSQVVLLADIFDKFSRLLYGCF
jgi:hypothetical protein